MANEPVADVGTIHLTHVRVRRATGNHTETLGECCSLSIWNIVDVEAAIVNLIDTRVSKLGNLEGKEAGGGGQLTRVP